MTQLVLLWFLLLLGPAPHLLAVDVLAHAQRQRWRRVCVQKLVKSKRSTSVNASQQWESRPVPMRLDGAGSAVVELDDVAADATEATYDSKRRMQRPALLFFIFKLLKLSLTPPPLWLPAILFVSTDNHVLHSAEVSRPQVE